MITPEIKDTRRVMQGWIQSFAMTVYVTLHDVAIKIYFDSTLHSDVNTFIYSSIIDILYENRIKD